MGSLCAALALLAGCSTSPKSGGKPASTRPSATAGLTPPEAGPLRPDVERQVDAYAHFAAGIIHDLRGEPKEAERQFAASAAADPGHEPLVIELAHRLLQQQQPQQAVELLRRSAAQPDTTGLIDGWLGMALVQAGETNQAIAAFRTAIRKAPQSILGYHGLAQLYFQSGQPQSALEVLDAAAAQKNATTPFVVDIADLLTTANRAKYLTPEQAKPRVLGLLERAALQDPAHPIVLQKMADLYKAMGELARAAELYQELLEKHSRRNPALAPLLREQLVRLYLASGDQAKAAEQLKLILEQNPTNPQAHLLLGAIAAEAKQYKEASSSYQRAILLDPELEPAYYDLAGMQIAMGQPQAALDTLSRARAKFTSSFILEFYSGIANAGLKEYAEALKHYTSAELYAKTTEPSRLNHLFYFQVGSAYERWAQEALTHQRAEEAERHFAEAENHLRKSIEIEPENPDALNYLGYMWAERGVNLPEAREFIERALKAEPDNDAFLDSMAWVLFKLNQPREALEYMLRAIQAAEKPDPTLFDHLGDIHAALGHAAEARAAWEKALSLEPNETIRRKLEAPPKSGPS